MCSQPYNLAFGLWWMMHPPADNPVDISLTERYFSKVTDAEKALKNLTNFTDFEVFHLFG
jgi:hypothetical protein